MDVEQVQRKVHNLVGLFFIRKNHSVSVPATLTLASCFLYSLASKSIKCRVFPMAIIVNRSLSWEIESNASFKSTYRVVAAAGVPCASVSWDSWFGLLPPFLTIRIWYDIYCVIYLTKKFWLPLKLSLLRRSRPKSARASPQHLAHVIQDFVQIGSLLAELYPNVWRLFFCPIEYFHDRLFESIKMVTHVWVFSLSLVIRVFLFVHIVVLSLAA